MIVHQRKREGGEGGGKKRRRGEGGDKKRGRGEGGKMKSEEGTKLATCMFLKNFNMIFIAFETIM